MGLKSGSRDSGLDDAEESAKQDQQTNQNDPAESEQSTADAEANPVDDEAEEMDKSGADGEKSQKAEQRGPPVESIPYKLRRNQVNEGRQQVPYFLRPSITDGESELKETLETELGETVYKSDYREAAMVVAQRNPDLIAEVLREWGYDFG